MPRSEGRVQLTTPAMRAGRADLIVEDVGLLLDKDRVAGTAPARERHLIAHRAAGHEHGGLLTDHLGGQRLELRNGGIVAEYVIAEGGVRCIASHISGEGRVTVSERRSTRWACGLFVMPMGLVNLIEGV